MAPRAQRGCAPVKQLVEEEARDVMTTADVLMRHLAGKMHSNDPEPDGGQMTDPEDGASSGRESDQPTAAPAEPAVDASWLETEKVEKSADTSDPGIDRHAF
jgi:hypothetical protein